jgi:16S rRNA (uracil1498-N3)-methyltransferase
MQLFVTDYKKSWTAITISNPDILSQVRKVLRAKIGDIIWIQDIHNEAEKVRYELQIETWNDKDILWKILSEHIHELTPGQTTMIVAMPNKWNKAELIVQKLSEIGISKIIFWPSERSVTKDRNSKKEERLQKIIKEAVEQSRWRSMPELIFTSNVAEYIENTTLIIFDKTGTRYEELGTRPVNLAPSPKSHITGIVGPEGGLTAKDYQQFEASKPQIVDLWTTVLRMETAAIVWWRLLKNNFKC